MTTATETTKLSRATILSAINCAIRNEEDAIVFTTAGNPANMVCSVSGYEESPHKGNLIVVARIDREGNYVD